MTTVRNQMNENDRYRLEELPSMLYSEEANYDPKYTRFGHTPAIRMISKNESLMDSRGVEKNNMHNPDIYNGIDNTTEEWDPLTWLGDDLTADMEPGQISNKKKPDKKSGGKGKKIDNKQDKNKKSGGGNVESFDSKSPVGGQNSMKSCKTGDAMINLLVIIVLIFGGMFVYSATASYVSFLDSKPQFKVEELV